MVDLEGRRAKTYGELANDVDRISGALLEAGAGAGDVVTVQLPNWYETVVIDLAVIKIGAILNPVLPIYRANELRAIFRAAATKVVFTPATYRGFDHADVISSLRDGAPSLADHVVVADPTADPGSPVLPRLESGSSPPCADVAASAISELIFTSGTEAQPKAIMHTEETTNFAGAFGLDRARARAHGCRMDAISDRALDGVQLWRQGRALPRPHPGAPGCVERSYGRGARAAAPVHVHGRGDDVPVRPAEPRGEHPCDLSSMRLFNSGGAPVPAELVSGAEALGFNVLRLYGSTEVLVATWNRPGSPREKQVGTDGLPMEHIELEVRDDDGTPIVGAAGEIFIRGPSTSVGFFDDPERTQATFDGEGWVRSGDIGVLDDDGYLTIVGRKKEIIIRGGLNIAPRELEDLIVQHAAVDAVAVVGVPDPRLGETVCACVVVNEGGSLTLDDVVAHLRARGVATFKLPQQLLLVVSLPTTPTGKVQKFELVGAAVADRQRAASA